MSEVAIAPKPAAPKVAKTSKAVKAPKVAKPKMPEVHPKFSVMISAAISSLNERKGSSRQAILKYVMANYKVGTDQKAINSRVKVALRNGLAKSVFVSAKGTGASGSFKNVQKHAAVAKPKDSPIKKAPAKKPKTAKKSGSTPKKATIKKAAKSPAKVAKKPKSAVAKKPTAEKKVKAAKVKTHVKKVAKKSPVKKVAKKVAPAKK